MDRVQTALPCLLQQKGNLEKTVFFATFTVTDSLICVCSRSVFGGKKKGWAKSYSLYPGASSWHALIRWLMFTFASPEDWYPLVQFQNVAPFNKRARCRSTATDLMHHTWSSCNLRNPSLEQIGTDSSRNG